MRFSDNNSFRFVVEIPVRIDITIEELWIPFNRSEFGIWLQSNNDEVIAFANNNFIMFGNRPLEQPLRFAYSGTESYVKKSDITFLAPLINCETKTYEHIQVAFDNFCQQYIVATDRICAPVCGDFQV